MNVKVHLKDLSTNSVQKVVVLDKDTAVSLGVISASDTWAPAASRYVITHLPIGTIE